MDEIQVYILAYHEPLQKDVTIASSDPAGDSLTMSAILCNSNSRRKSNKCYDYAVIGIYFRTMALFGLPMTHIGIVYGPNYDELAHIVKRSYRSMAPHEREAVNSALLAARGYYFSLPQEMANAEMRDARREIGDAVIGRNLRNEFMRDLRKAVAQ